MMLPATGIDPVPTAPAERLTVRIVLSAAFVFLPELLLVNSEIWVAIAMADWAFGSLFRLSSTGFMVLTALFGALGLWATWQTIRLAAINRDLG